MVLLTLLVLGNLAGSFFCSLSEAALLAASEARIRARLQSGDRRMRRLLQLKQDPKRTLASIVFLNNIFAIGGSMVLSAIATEVIGTPTGMGIFIIVQTFLIIAFGEITPKVLGEANPESISGFVGPALVWVRRLLAPLVWMVERAVAWAHPKSRVLAGEEAEIRELAKLGGEEGRIDPEEAELIRRVFRLDDITAEDVMTPRPLVKAFQVSSRIGDLRAELLETSHWQFPVYEEDLDKVTGILSLRDALAALANDQDDKTVAELQRPAIFLPTSRQVDDVLRDLQSKHGRMGIVIDEYGITEGIVTLDDLVEELVGEAIDASDVSEGLVKRVSRDAALVHGLTRVRDIARFLQCGVIFTSSEEENTTITGLIQERLKRIPREGDRIEVEGCLQFEVKEADERTALRVLARHIRDDPS